MAMGFADDMINKIRQNTSLRASTKSYQSRKYKNSQDSYSTREYSEKEIKEERERLTERIKRNRRYKMGMLLVVFLAVISFAIYAYIINR